MNFGADGENCTNSISAAKWLSVYSTITRAVSIISKTVPKAERSEALTWLDLAILRMSWSKKLQGVLRLVAFLLSMFFFSVLGSEEQSSDRIYYLGAVGSIAVALNGLIEVVTLLRSSREAKKAGKAPSLAGAAELRWSAKTFSVDDQFALGCAQGKGELNPIL